MIEYIVLIGISTFVITFFVMSLSGPFGIFGKMHDWAVSVKVNESMPMLTDCHPFFAGLYNCFYCMSTWVCILVTVLYVFLISIPIRLALPVFIGGLGFCCVLYMVLIPSEE